MSTYLQKRDGGISGLNSAMQDAIPLEENSCSALSLVYEAAGDTPDDLSPAEIDKFIAGRCGNYQLPAALCSRAAFLNFAGQTIDAYLPNDRLSVPAINKNFLLDLSDVPSSEIKILQSHGVATEQAPFLMQLAKLRETHEARIVLGNMDMIGSYFVIQGCRDAKDFLNAVERDGDLNRKALINKYLDMAAYKVGTDNRELAAKALLERAVAQSGRYQITEDRFNISQYFYAFAERGFRTTSRLFHAIYPSGYIDTADFKKQLNGKVRRVLIIGPGLEFINQNTGNIIARQMYEPFAIADALWRNGLIDASTLEIDLLDINPDVIKHICEATQNARQGHGYRLTLALDTEEAGHDDLRFYFDHFGENLPGTRRNTVLNLDTGVLQMVEISPAVVSSLNPIEGDVTTDKFSADGEYDLVLCFNTFVYFSEAERVLAGINIARAMKKGAVFLTDNMLIADSGARPGSPVKDEKVRDLFSKDFSLGLKTGLVVNSSDNKMATMVVYKKND